MYNFVASGSEKYQAWLHTCLEQTEGMFTIIYDNKLHNSVALGK